MCFYSLALCTLATIRRQLFSVGSPPFHRPMERTQALSPTSAGFLIGETVVVHKHGRATVIDGPADAPNTDKHGRYRQVLPTSLRRQLASQFF
jgi:hypothetical protein